MKKEKIVTVRFTQDEFDKMAQQSPNVSAMIREKALGASPAKRKPAGWDDWERLGEAIEELRGLDAFMDELVKKAGSGAREKPIRWAMALIEKKSAEASPISSGVLAQYAGFRYEKEEYSEYYGCLVRGVVHPKKGTVVFQDGTPEFAALEGMEPGAIIQ